MKTRGRSGIFQGVSGERFQRVFQGYSRGVVAGIFRREKGGKKEFNRGLFKGDSARVLELAQRDYCWEWLIPGGEIICKVRPLGFTLVSSFLLS
ncbi:hypothetical protein L484_006272 [Morus notabilis]|uniref:Uncharacterized protein n=1 Tax=Morus notabilis TaxID=981085 RepID=W9QU81_9ROSA|nr:hypothetical protein L484_006272 [Morus notabilis]